MDSQSQYLYKDRKYQIVPYITDWKNQFAIEAEKIRNIFGKEIHIEHVGSTAVPGMEGKSCIDILVLIDDLSVMNKYIEDVCKLGYDYSGQFIMDGSRLFRKMKDGELLVNIHFFTPGHPHAQEMISVRDYLRAHPEEVKKYSDAKKELYKKYPNDYAEYRKQKDIYMEDLTKRAMR